MKSFFYLKTDVIYKATWIKVFNSSSTKVFKLFNCHISFSPQPHNTITALLVKFSSPTPDISVIQIQFEIILRSFYSSHKSVNLWLKILDIWIEVILRNNNPKSIWECHQDKNWIKIMFTTLFWSLLLYKFVLSAFCVKRLLLMPSKCFFLRLQKFFCFSPGWVLLHFLLELCLCAILKVNVMH